MMAGTSASTVAASGGFTLEKLRQVVADMKLQQMKGWFNSWIEFMREHGFEPEAGDLVVMPAAEYDAYFDRIGGMPGFVRRSCVVNRCMLLRRSAWEPSW